MPMCLFCHNEDVNQFSQEEHIIPESLGNRTYVLPKGIVCDKCNSYFSKLDKYFCHHHLGSAHKLLARYKTKKGKPPSMPLEAGEVRQDETGDIHFHQSLIAGKEGEQFSISFFANDVVIRANLPLPDTHSKKMSRFLAKAGIETLYLKMENTALQPDFDFVRNYARFGSRRDFVPFLWCAQPRRTIDSFIGTFDSKKYGRFYFGIILLPGIVYLIPLNRAKEDYAVNAIKNFATCEGNTFNLCVSEQFIKREPIELTAHFASDAEPDPEINKDEGTREVL